MRTHYSTRRKYRLGTADYGVVRLCHDCQAELDGDDRRVMNHLYKLAGYPV